MNTIGSPPYCEAVWWVRGGSYEKDIAKNNAYNLTNIKRDTPSLPSSFRHGVPFFRTY
ncbi:MAG: hypothetical protein JRI44_13255 [Deltaproteobacteria bacterium]|nr:hypothetical protein [Deltaproteobacteria bacterium]